MILQRGAGEAQAVPRLQFADGRRGFGGGILDVLSLVEDQSQRAAGASVAEQFAAVPWREAMATLAELALPYVHRFQSLLDVAPPEDVPWVRFMVDHEQSVVRIAGRESAGEAIMASELVVMLAHPFAAFEQ